MKILLIDTCGTTGSITLADAHVEPPVIVRASLPGRTASERLVPAIKELVASTGTGLESVGAVAVVHGPGSFTGVRVALSAAKGFCEALSLPLVAVSRLAVLAYLVGQETGQVRALLDAGRGEFYSGLYVGGICLREALLTQDELIAAEDAASSSVIVVCEPAVAELLAVLSPRLVGEPGAEDALPLALQRIRQQDFDDIATLDANYLRRTDAEIFAKPRVVRASIDSLGAPAR